MMRSVSLFVPLLVLLLSACGDGDNPDRPVDGRDTDGLYEPSIEPYEGRVIDGYLRNARVWIDLDGDYQYDADTVDVPLDSDPVRTLTLEGGEPTVMSGEGGRFTLDVSAFEIDPAVGPNLDPRDFPLVAVAIPGVTEEETPAGNVTVDQAFMMSAMPGTRNITPLTTVADARRQLVLGPVDVTGSDPGASLGPVNIGGDYVRSGDDRAQAYAKGLVRFLKNQFPDNLQDEVRDQAGRVTAFDSDAQRILRLSLLRFTEEIITTIDTAAAGGSYANVDIDALELPLVPLDLDNPILLRGVRVRAPEADIAPASTTGITNESNISAELTYNYSEAGVLLSIESDGCMSPSLYEMARLANVNGRVRDLNTQGFEGFFLKLQDSQTFWMDDKVNERLVFDYENQQARFFTATTCHDGLASVSELGDEPQNTFSWTLDEDGRVERVESSATNETIEMDYANGVDPAYGFANQAGKRFELTGPIAACLDQVDAEDEGKSRIITGQQPYLLDQTLATDNALSLTLDWDIRNSTQRLLRRIVALPSLDSGLLEWEYDYVIEGEFAVPEQPNLIRDASLSQTNVADTNECGSLADGQSSSNVYALINHEYIFLADYLEQTQ